MSSHPCSHLGKSMAISFLMRASEVDAWVFSFREGSEVAFMTALASLAASGSFRNSVRSNDSGKVVFQPFFMTSRIAVGMIRSCPSRILFGASSSLCRTSLELSSRDVSVHYVVV